MGGPWFKVHKVGDGWTVMGTTWLSNGEKAGPATVYGRLEFDD